MNEIMKNSVSFLSETWLTSTKYTSMFERKFCMVSHADKYTKGRQFGGLHIIANPNLKPKPISESKRILALEIRGVSIIGCYYEPSFEINSIINELSQVIDKAKSKDNSMCI